MLDNDSEDLQIAAIRALAAIGEPAVETLTSVVDGDNIILKSGAVLALLNIGEPAMIALQRALDDEDLEVKLTAVSGLAHIGKPALPALERALNAQPFEVQIVTIQGLGRLIGEPAIPILGRVVNHQTEALRPIAVYELGVVGDAALNVLEHALSHKDVEVRKAVVGALTRIGGPAAARLLVLLLEDTDETVSDYVIQYLSDPGFHEHIDWASPIDPQDVAKFIVDELIVRGSGRPDSDFNSLITVRALQTARDHSYKLRAWILKQLCDLAYQNTGPIRSRAIEVARRLDAGDFAAQVRVQAEEHPDSAAAIMRLLGGGEAAAFFSELQSRSLERYRAPLVSLEEVSLNRWDDLTRQARNSFYINVGMSVSVFLMGSGVVIWGLVLMTRSDEVIQQIGGGLLAAVSAFITTYSGRFWKDPVEHIQRFSAQQARLQAAFIGYMNRVAQLRLMFEKDYTTGDITVEDLGLYQKLLNEAIDQASQQLVDQHGDI